LADTPRGDLDLDARVTVRGADECLRTYMLASDGKWWAVGCDGESRLVYSIPEAALLAECQRLKQENALLWSLRLEEFPDDAEPGTTPSRR